MANAGIKSNQRVEISAAASPRLSEVNGVKTEDSIQKEAEMLDQIKYEDIASILHVCDKPILESSQNAFSSIIVQSVSTNSITSKLSHTTFHKIPASELAECKKGSICKACSQKIHLVGDIECPKTEQSTHKAQDPRNSKSKKLSFNMFNTF